MRVVPLVVVLGALQPCRAMVLDLGHGALGPCGPVEFVEGGPDASLPGCDAGTAAIGPVCADWPCDAFEQHATVQEAIDAAPDGATVLVCPGENREHVRVVGRDLALSSASHSPGDTILRGDGGTILTARDSTLHVSDLSLVGGVGEGGAIDAHGGSLRLSNVVAERNRARSSGGAVRFDGAVLEVDGSTFADNVSGYAGGAVVVAEGCAVVTGSTFEGNQADYEGGAISFGGWDGGRLEVLDSTFLGNVSGYEGGAIDAGAWALVEVEVTRSVFEDNVADYAGGAVAVGSHEKNVVRLVDSDFRRNEARGGGAVTVGGWADDELHVDGGVFEGNVGRHGGGAIAAGGWGQQVATVSGATFLGNSGQDGSAMAFVGQGTTDVELEDTTVEGNSGGAAIVHAVSRISGAHVRFADNGSVDLRSDCGARDLGPDASFTCDDGSWSRP